VTPNRRGSEKAHRGASAATHLAAVTPVACMAFGGAPSGVRARAKFATTRSTRETRGVECGECAAPLGDLSRNNEAENREMTWIDESKKGSVPLGGENKRHIAHTEEASESNLHPIHEQSEEMEKRASSIFTRSSESASKP
jgi:hypothetical protein